MFSVSASNTLHRGQTQWSDTGCGLTNSRVNNFRTLYKVHGTKQQAVHQPCITANDSCTPSLVLCMSVALKAANEAVVSGNQVEDAGKRGEKTNTTPLGVQYREA